MSNNNSSKRKKGPILASAAVGVGLTFSYGILAFSQGATPQRHFKSEDSSHAGARAGHGPEKAARAGSEEPGTTPPTYTGSPRQVFTGEFIPLNPNFSTTGGGVSASLMVMADQNHFGVTLANVQGLDPNLIHQAFIYKGDACPTLEEDTNQDGLLDIVEARPATGGILIHVDGNLSTFPAGSGYIPSADSNGVLDFISNGNLGLMLANLHRKAPDPSTGIATLKKGERLDLNQVVIMIHGVDPNVDLPPSVQTIRGLTTHQSLPVACAELVSTRGSNEPLPILSPVTPGDTPPAQEPTFSPSPDVSPTASPTPEVTAMVTPIPSPTESPSPEDILGPLPDISPTPVSPGEDST